MSEKISFISFEAWLTSVLPSIPSRGIAAYNFNLAESHDWVVEVIGASSYDKDGNDWACPPVAWSSSPSEFFIPRYLVPTWEQALAYVSERVNSYLTNGKHPQAAVLRQAEAVCVGFVDGDLNLVWTNKKDNS